MSLPVIPAAEVTDVTTQNIGFAPILRYYFEKCGIVEIIDENVSADPRRKGLTHGEAAVAMITAILFQVMQLYRIRPFAEKNTVLNVIFPHVSPEEYFDDRLADTLDALFRSGLGEIEVGLTRHIIETFGIRNEICHNDTTSASFYGEGVSSPESIELTFGHSKKHREDLKQLIWSMSVSSDSAFPLFQQAYSGNTADVTTYVEQWNRLIDLLGTKDFLFIADCKVITKDNMAAICGNEGFFLAPAPMYESYAKVFEEAIAGHGCEILIPHKGRLNRGFEVPMSFRHNKKEYQLRMIILFDHSLGKRKRKGLDRRIGSTRKAFEDLEGRLNRRKLKTREAIEKKCGEILKKHRTSPFFSCEITNTPVISHKNSRPGRPAKNAPAEKTEIRTDHFSVRLIFDDQAYEKAADQCGYYPLLTNRSAEDLSIAEAMKAHRNQYKSEHTFRRSKGPYDLEPVYLRFPERIEAYLFLFKIALQILVLIERSGRQNIEKRGRGLDNFMPNRKDVRNPRAEYLPDAFRYIVIGRVPVPDGTEYGFVSELEGWQRDILEVLGVPISVYSYRYLVDSG